MFKAGSHMGICCETRVCIPNSLMLSKILMSIYLHGVIPVIIYISLLLFCQITKYMTRLYNNRLIRQFIVTTLTLTFWFNTNDNGKPSLQYHANTDHVKECSQELYK